MASARHTRFVLGFRLGLVLLPLVASGCVAVVVGGAAVGGYAILASDLPARQQMRDFGIRAEVSGSWGQFNSDMPHYLDATVFDGEVLITGHVPDEKWHEEAVKRTWKIEGVKQVYDDIVVGPDTHFADSARDTWISTRLRGELVGDTQIKSINYTIKTTDGVVHIMGYARSKDELNRVTEHARAIPDVKKVVTFIRIITLTPPAEVRDAPRPPPPGDAGAPPPPPSGPPAANRPSNPSGSIQSEELK